MALIERDLIERVYVFTGPPNPKFLTPRVPFRGAIRARELGARLMRVLGWGFGHQSLKKKKPKL